MKKIRIIFVLIFTMFLSFLMLACTVNSNNSNQSSTSTEENKTEIITKEYIITFSGVDIASQKVKKGMKATKPNDPTKDGYRFNGWYLEENCINEFDFNKEITSNIVLYPNWIKNSYTITFNTIGKCPNPEQLSNLDKIPNSLPIISAEGYQFNGWYLDEEYLTKADYGLILSNDITLYAKWTKIENELSNDYFFYTKIKGGYSISRKNLPLSIIDIIIPSYYESEPIIRIEDVTFGYKNDENNLINVYYDGTIEDWCNISFAESLSNPMFFASYFYILDENGTTVYNGKKYDLVNDIVIPNSITTIREFQFFGFNNIKSIIIPSSVTSIGDSAFSGCRSLTSITIPEGVTSIEDSTFRGCSSLTSITIPSSVISIGKYAFNGCYRLVEIYNLSTLNINKGSTDNGYIGRYTKVIHSSAY